MPNQQILNFMNQGAPPLISEQVKARNLAQAQGYADVNSTMAATEMQGMKNAAMRERSSVLKNFEGNTRSPEFARKMNAVDPKMLADMQNQAAKMDKAEREQMLEKFSEISRIAGMSDSPNKWQQSGFSVPFQERDNIMSKAMTMQQVLDYKEDEYDRSQPGGKGGKAWTMKAADSNSIKASINSLYKGVYGPTGGFNFSNKEKGREAAKISKRASEVYRQGQGQISHNEAAYQAMEEAYGPPKNKQDPLGLKQ